MPTIPDSPSILALNHREAMSKTPMVNIGKYQVLEMVGEGAMGTVYRALDPVINRTVAIKVMSDSIARDAALRDRFMREAQAAGSLQHPNVVTIYDFGDFEGHLFIAMEFVDGIDLEEMIERHVPMTLDQRLGIVIDVLVGLSYAHKHGVIHRDIKPANIRITEDGRAKIMDFGVAHLESAQMTATGVMVGTPNYMAPEQVTGQRVGPATDIFAVGAVLYELLSRRKAFGADSLHNVLFKVVSEEPPSLTLVAPEVPASLDPIVRRAIGKEPEQRYQSAQEMANELTSIRSRLSTDQRSPSLSLVASIASRTGERKVPAAAARPGARGSIWRSRRVLVGSATVGVAMVGATWVLATRRTATEIAPSSTVSTPAILTPQAPSSTGTTADSSSPSRTDAPRPKAATSDASPTRRQPPPATSVGSVATPGREAEIVNVVRTSALQARSRALSAGATAAQLASGDEHLTEAERHTTARRYPDAVAAMNAAAQSWNEAERQAQRAAAMAAAARASEESARVRFPPVSPPPVSAAPTVVVPKQAETPAPNPGLEIASLVAEYARAIETRDLSAIRALYPSITEAQQRGFREFFGAVRTLRATLAAEAPSIDGNTASARIAGAYDYTNAAGKAERQPVTFTATFRRDGTRWRIASVR